jgi:hypothetical protein
MSPPRSGPGSRPVEAPGAVAAPGSGARRSLILCHRCHRQTMRRVDGVPLAGKATGEAVYRRSYRCTAPGCDAIAQTVDVRTNEERASARGETSLRPGNRRRAGARSLRSRGDAQVPTEGAAPPRRRAMYASRSILSKRTVPGDGRSDRSVPACASLTTVEREIPR